MPHCVGITHLRLVAPLDSSVQRRVEAMLNVQCFMLREREREKGGVKERHKCMYRERDRAHRGLVVPLDSGVQRRMEECRASQVCVRTELDQHRGRAKIACPPPKPSTWCFSKN